MKVAIMQPYLFPYIGYFQLINAVDKFVIYDDVSFINRGWINRNNILVSGKSNMFTIPLKEASQNKLINEIAVVEDNVWRSKFLKTIDMAYKKAPFYDSVFPLIKNIVEQPSASISEFVFYSIMVLTKHLSITTEIIPTSAKYKNVTLKGQERILDICIQEGADNYINPIGGTELYSRELFQKQQIQLHFIQSLPLLYKQFNNEFVPWLSIIDVLMFNSADEIAVSLHKYKLV